MSSFQLAELNSARLRAPLDAPMIKDFADGLARITPSQKPVQALSGGSKMTLATPPRSSRMTTR